MPNKPLEAAILKRPVPTMRAPTLQERYTTQQEDAEELASLTPWQRANRTGNILDLLPEFLRPGLEQGDKSGPAKAAVYMMSPQVIRAYHGTRAAFKKFNPSKFGHQSQPGYKYVHAGNDPKTAEAVALEGRVDRVAQDRSNLNIIPITNARSTKVLDISGGHMDDFFNDAPTKQVIKDLAKREHDRLERIADARWINRSAVERLEHLSKDRRNLYGAALLNNPYTLLDMISPSTMSREGIGAVKYTDIGRDAWAFPPREPLQTFWGTPLTRNFPNPLETAILPTVARWTALPPGWMSDFDEFVKYSQEQWRRAGKRGKPKEQDLMDQFDELVHKPELWWEHVTPGPPAPSPKKVW